MKDEYNLDKWDIALLILLCGAAPLIALIVLWLCDFKKCTFILKNSESEVNEYGEDGEDGEETRETE